jgi:hypothetical protein
VAKGILNSKWCNPKDKHSLRFVVMDDVKGLDALMDKPAEEEYMEMGIRVDADAHLRDYNGRVRDCSYTQKEVTHTERPLFRVSPAINNHKDATATRPSPSAGRFVLLCGETTLKTRVLDKTREIKIRIVRTVSTGGGEKREVEEIPAKHITSGGELSLMSSITRKRRIRSMLSFTTTSGRATRTTNENHGLFQAHRLNMAFARYSSSARKPCPA